MQNTALTDEELDKLLIEYMPKANIILDQLEEERDKNIAPHIFSKRYQRNIKKIIKDYSSSATQKKFTTFRKCVAVFFILIVLINSTLIISVEAYRERFFEMIIDVYEKFTSIITEVKEDNLDDELNFTKPSYIPEGFEVISDMQTDITRKIDYLGDNKIIVFMQSIITSEETRIDTENTSISEMEINKNIVSYTLNKEIYNAYWIDSKFTYSITAEVSFEELIKIIEGIQK